MFIVLMSHILHGATIQTEQTTRHQITLEFQYGIYGKFMRRTYEATIQYCTWYSKTTEMIQREEDGRREKERANRVIVVNELYALLSNQKAVNVTQTPALYSQIQHFRFSRFRLVCTQTVSMYNRKMFLNYFFFCLNEGTLYSVVSMQKKTLNVWSFYL